MRWLRKEVLCEHLLFCLSGGVPAGRLLHCTQGAAAGGAFGQHSAGVRVRGLTAGICSGLFCGGTGFPAACPFVGRSCCGRAGRLVGAARHAVHPCTGSGRRRSVGLCATLGCCYPVPAAHPCAASGRRQLSHRAKLLWRYGDAPGIHQKHCRYRQAAAGVSPAGRRAPVRLPVFVRDHFQRFSGAGGRRPHRLPAAHAGRIHQRVRHDVAAGAAGVGQRGQSLPGFLAVLYGQRVRVCVFPWQRRGVCRHLYRVLHHPHQLHCRKHRLGSTPSWIC